MPKIMVKCKFCGNPAELNKDGFVWGHYNYYSHPSQMSAAALESGAICEAVPCQMYKWEGDDEQDNNNG